MRVLDILCLLTEEEPPPPRGLGNLLVTVKVCTNTITGSNDVGDYLGTQKDKHSFIAHNKGLSINVYPINVAEHEGQYATYAILAAKGKGSDPLCIVDLGLGLPNVSTRPETVNASQCQTAAGTF